MKNIADHIHSIRPWTVILLGDTWHHRGGKLRDCNDGRVKYQIYPFSEEWRSQNFELIGIAGNTDPEWARYQRGQRSRIHELLLDREQRGNVTVPDGGLVHVAPHAGADGGFDLFTHGHIFLPDDLRTNLHAVLTGDPEGGRVYGSRICHALSPQDTFLKEVSSQHGAHLWHSRLFRVVRHLVPLRRYMKRIYTGLHLSALREAGCIVQEQQERPLRSLFMGHTHVPSLQRREGRTIVNTGTAGAAKSPVATFVEVDEQGGVRFMQSWQPELRHKVEPFPIEA